jgi:hypothetical protein
MISYLYGMDEDKRYDTMNIKKQGIAIILPYFGIVINERKSIHRTKIILLSKP